MIGRSSRSKTAEKAFICPATTIVTTCSWDNITKKSPALAAGQLYEFQVSVKLVTNVEGGMIGVGESPSSSVYVKDGITSEKPRHSANEQNQYLLNIDKGNKKPADTICFF